MDFSLYKLFGHFCRESWGLPEGTKGEAWVQGLANTRAFYLLASLCHEHLSLTWILVLQGLRCQEEEMFRPGED